MVPKCLAEVYYTFLESKAGLSAVPSIPQIPPLTFVLLAVVISTKAVWKSTTVVSGRLSVTTPGTSKKQRWSVGGWSTDMPYWQYRVLPLARDQAGNWRRSGPALGMSSTWLIAAAAMPFAPTLKMHL